MVCASITSRSAGSVLGRSLASPISTRWRIRHKRCFSNERMCRVPARYNTRSRLRSRSSMDTMLERERNLDRVLYLAGTRHIRSLLKQRLWRIRQRVLIGLASDLPKTEPADLEVIDAQTMQVYRLVDVP